MSIIASPHCIKEESGRATSRGAGTCQQSLIVNPLGPDSNCSTELDVIAHLVIRQAGIHEHKELDDLTDGSCVGPAVDDSMMRFTRFRHRKKAVIFSENHAARLPGILHMRDVWGALKSRIGCGGHVDSATSQAFCHCARYMFIKMETHSPLPCDALEALTGFPLSCGQLVLPVASSPGGSRLDGPRTRPGPRKHRPG